MKNKLEDEPYRLNRQRTTTIMHKVFVEIHIYKQIRTEPHIYICVPISKYITVSSVPNYEIIKILCPCRRSQSKTIEEIITNI